MVVTVTVTVTVTVSVSVTVTVTVVVAVVVAVAVTVAVTVTVAVVGMISVGHDDSDRAPFPRRFYRSGLPWERGHPARIASFDTAHRRRAKGPRSQAGPSQPALRS